MTRINTNVSSLVAQNTLGRSNASLNQALTRLSTGLRINTGKDDPAGLIASENLRSDITSIKRAIGNTDRANQVIATADSSLGQVSSLLNDIRGLVTESANTGVLSQDQIDANQLQVDSSLEALNRIAQTTTFQGRRLLDGSLNFLTTAGTGFGTVTNLEIDQANLGTSPTLAVNVTIGTAATQAQLTNGSIAAATVGVRASDTLTFNDAAVGSTGTVDIAVARQDAVFAQPVNFTTTGAAGLNVAVVGTGAAAGAQGAVNGGIDFVFTQDGTVGGGVNTATYDVPSNEIRIAADFAGGVQEDAIAAAIQNINGASSTFTATAVGTAALAAGDAGTYSNVGLGGQDAEVASIAVTGTAGAASNISITLTEANGHGSTATASGSAAAGYTITIDDTVATTIDSIRSAIAGITEVASATTSSTASFLGSADSTPATDSLTGGADATQDVITVTADAEGTAANGVAVSIVEAAAHGAPTAAIDGSGNIVVTTDTAAATTITQINNVIDSLTGYSAQVTDSSGDDTYINGTDNSVSASLAGGAAASGGLADDVVFEVSGKTGAEVLSFGANTSITSIVAGINAVSDATGVSATDNGGVLELNSTGYGSSAFVNINILSGDDSGAFSTGLSGVRDEGTDVVGTVNGITAKGDGNSLSINTATLDLSLTVDAGSSTDVNFTITGGGALFQLGPDVVSNQQARIGITSVNTAQLGGASGKLFQLGSGGTADLNTDTTTAALIVEEAIDQITTLRGRLGAFQRTTLETNKNALNDVLVNLTEAESLIRDADFASESAALTRSQILVQSGTTVLQIANSNPQNVLALLR